MHEQTQSKLNRRKFVGALGLLGAASGLAPIAALAKPRTLQLAEGALMKCKPYLQAAQTDSITIRWITSAPCHTWVEYGESPDKLTHKAQQIVDGMVQVVNTIHAITLTGLQPGKKYYYRTASTKTEKLVRKNQAFSTPEFGEVYSFTTVPAQTDSVEFLVFNDIHDRPESFDTLMPYQGAGKKDFVFLNGDMFNQQEDEAQIINHLLEPLTKHFATTVPFILARGNHETWGPYATQLGHYFGGQEHKYYYSFEYGPMYALVMDSGETKPDEDPVNAGINDFDAYRAMQGQWLAKEVQKEAFKKAKYRVVFIHIPPYYLGKNLEPGQDHASEQYMKIWGPIFEASKIDLMLCGHTHRHGVHLPVAGKHSYPIVIGGGPKDGIRTIINIKVTTKALNLIMTDDSGQVVGTVNI